MSYIQESLSEGERLETLFKLHWLAWMPMVGSTSPYPAPTTRLLSVAA